MSSTRIFAIVLLVVGAVLFTMGVIASDSFADHLSRTFTGHFTDQTTWYLLGGLAAAVAGVVMLAIKKPGRA